MHLAPILFVTGKGGSGKTTVACALARALAARDDRVLLVEPDGHRGLASHFDLGDLAGEPTAVADNVFAARLAPRSLLESYFGKLLRLPALAHRLLSSATFNAVTAAAPGVSEFLTLERLDEWSRCRDFDHIVFDAPATGHALQLLRAPSQLASIATRGPLHQPLRKLTGMLANPKRTNVAVVSLCEEMAVAEASEAHRIIGGELGVTATRPILNRCAERRFTHADIRAIDELDPDQPLVATAQHQIAAQRRTAHFASVLRSVFGQTPLRLPELAPDVHGGATSPTLGPTLVRGLHL